MSIPIIPPPPPPLLLPPQHNTAQHPWPKLQTGPFALRHKGGFLGRRDPGEGILFVGFGLHGHHYHLPHPRMAAWLGGDPNSVWKPERWMRSGLSQSRRQRGLSEFGILARFLSMFMHVHVLWLNNDFAFLLPGTFSVSPLNEVFLTVPLPNINYAEH